MAITIKQLALDLNITQAELLQKFKLAGIEKTASSTVSATDQNKLLAFLNAAQTQSPKKLTLGKKRSASETTTPSAGSAVKTDAIKVQIRRKKVLVRVTASNSEQGVDELPTITDAKPLSAHIVADDALQANSSNINNLDTSTEIADTAIHGSVQSDDSALVVTEKAKVKGDKLVAKSANAPISASSDFTSVSSSASPNVPAAKSTSGNVAGKTATNTSISATPPSVKSGHTDGRPSIAKVVRKTNKMKVIGVSDSSLDDLADDLTLDSEALDNDGNEEVLHALTSERGINTGNSFTRPFGANNASTHWQHKKSFKTTKSPTFRKPAVSQVLDLVIPVGITVGDLAHKMSLKASALIKALMTMGVMATINQSIDQDTAILLVQELGHNATAKSDDEKDILNSLLLEEANAPSVSRSPIVTIMGHVDHGKTSLLDYIRKAKVASAEAGGITQHVGAYHVVTPSGAITFLDTPGHEAFTKLRARGAKVTDIVVLVVAADDGVMPQTIEAIAHAKAANVPLIVAINKIDKPGANADKVKQELTAHEVVIEEYGGDVMCIPVSAHTGQGVDGLLEAILLQSHVLELNTKADTKARGVIIESRLDKGKGVVASILVQSGTLKKGDMVVAGTSYGRIKAMFDEHGKSLEKALPSFAVEVLGFSEVPEAGDDALVINDERLVREIVALRITKAKHKKFTAMNAPTTLENIFEGIHNKKIQNLPLIVKSDVQGSYEAIIGALEQLSNDEVKIKIVHAAIGGISESDVHLAIASGAIIIGFHTRADNNAKRIAQNNGVSIRYYNIIYEIIDDIKQALIGMLAPTKREDIVGNVVVRQIFTAGKLLIAGCMVTDGLIKRGSRVRVVRGGVVIYDGVLSSLKRFKDDVASVKTGYECGLSLESYSDLQLEDIIEAYEIVEVKRDSV